MNPPRVMLIAGEPSGDQLAADLVNALRPALTAPTAPTAPQGKSQANLQVAVAPTFFGAGGPLMAQNGVDLAFDMTEHAVIGLWEVIKRYPTFRRLFSRLLQLAIERRPDAILCVDFSGFNRRFARAVRQHIRQQSAATRDWNPRIVQFISPQVWASRPGRAKAMAQDFDLVLSIFPFEKAWYAKHAPDLPVEFVGHPLVDRYPKLPAKTAPDPATSRTQDATETEPKLPGTAETHSDYIDNPPGASGHPNVLLLPGSRPGELKRHWPVMLGAAEKIAAQQAVSFTAILPTAELAELTRTAEAEALIGSLKERGMTFVIQTGGLAEALGKATIALASTGTVTMECAFCGVPSITFYKTSWVTYQIGKRIIQVKSLTMPNLLADESLFPEFIQHEATPQNIAQAAIDLLENSAGRTAIRRKLSRVVDSLGEPGACERAAQAIARLLTEPEKPRPDTDPP